MSTGQEWAVKIIEKRRVRNPLDLEREIIILQNLNHPHIVNYKETFESTTHLMIVTELCAGGELFDRIVERQFYTEKDAANLLWEILGVVKYLHDRDIVHRDIKVCLCQYFYRKKKLKAPFKKTLSPRICCIQTPQTKPKSN